jgi:hypothetical protein
MTKAEANKRKFEDFNAVNPKVYALFCQFTQEVIDAGFTSYSAYAIMHRVRWEGAVVTKGDPYKISNNHIPFYARLYAQEHPKYKEFFLLRELTTERKAA